MNTPFSQPQLVNSSQMARRLRVQVSWIRSEAEAGRVPCLPTGKDFLFDVEATEAALLKRAAQAPEEAVSDG